MTLRKEMRMILLRKSKLFNPALKFNDLGKLLGITKQINWAEKNNRLIIIIDPRSIKEGSKDKNA